MLKVEESVGIAYPEQEIYGMLLTVGHDLFKLTSARVLGQHFFACCIKVIHSIC